MRTFEVKPGVGVGPIKLGMDRTEVYSALGPPSYKAGNREKFLDGFYISFDEQGAAEFLELARGKKYKVVFEGVDLHAVPVEKAVAAVEKRGSYDRHHPELGYSYIFGELQLSLWRGHKPEPDQPDDDEDGRTFEAVGLARAGYFQPTKAAASATPPKSKAAPSKKPIAPKQPAPKQPAPKQPTPKQPIPKKTAAKKPASKKAAPKKSAAKKGAKPAATKKAKAPAKKKAKRG